MLRAISIILLIALNTSYASIRLKSLAHVSGLQENPITGYGLVIGLSGTGDSQRNKDTTQAIAALLQTFGVTINPHDINAKNAAIVIVSANLPAHAHQGDKIDVNVASLGDARSLLGGTLLVTPLKGTDNQTYALAQGSVSIGGFKYDAYGNTIQKNHPTSGLIPSGAIVERTLKNTLIDKDGLLHLVLNHPDYTTAHHVEKALNKQYGPETAKATSAQDIDIKITHNATQHLVTFISQLENLTITPDTLPTIVINEKTGVIVAGYEVKIDPVTISHGHVQLSVATDFQVSQPNLLINPGSNIKTTVTPSVDMQVNESMAKELELKEGGTVGNLIKRLSQAHATTRDIIAILESLQRAGALHAELIIQ